MAKLTYTHGLSFLVKLLTNNKAFEIKSCAQSGKDSESSNGKVCKVTGDTTWLLMSTSMEGKLRKIFDKKPHCSQLLLQRKM